MGANHKLQRLCSDAGADVRRIDVDACGAATAAEAAVSTLRSCFDLPADRRYLHPVFSGADARPGRLFAAGVRVAAGGGWDCREGEERRSPGGHVAAAVPAVGMAGRSGDEAADGSLAGGRYRATRGG